MVEPLKLDLRENAYHFIDESLRYAAEAESDVRSWKLAIILGTQGVELLLKARLVDVHPLLVWTDVDRPRSGHTVGTDVALKRLSAAGVQLDPSDVRKLKAAARLRNQFLHYDVDTNAAHLRSLYLNVFEFAHVFSSASGDDLHSRLSEDLHTVEALLLQEFRHTMVWYNGMEVVSKYPIDLVESQFLPYILIGDKRIERGRCGAGGDLFDWGGGPCPNCAAAPGQLHVYLCTKEKCPACSGQAFSCNCDWEYEYDESSD